MVPLIRVQKFRALEHSMERIFDFLLGIHTAITNTLASSLKQGLIRSTYSLNLCYPNMSKKPMRLFS